MMQHELQHPPKDVLPDICCRVKLKDALAARLISPAWQEPGAAQVSTLLAQEMLLPAAAWSKFPNARALVITALHLMPHDHRARLAALRPTLPARLEAITFAQPDNGELSDEQLQGPRQHVIAEMVRVYAEAKADFLLSLPTAPFAGGLRQLHCHTEVTTACAQLLLARLPALQQCTLAVAPPAALVPTLLSAFPPPLQHLSIRCRHQRDSGTYLALDAKRLAACCGAALQALHLLLPPGGLWEAGAVAGCTSLHALCVQLPEQTDLEDTLRQQLIAATSLLPHLRQLHLPEAYVETSSAQWQQLCAAAAAGSDSAAHGSPGKPASDGSTTSSSTTTTSGLDDLQLEALAWDTIQAPPLAMRGKLQLDRLELYTEGEDAALLPMYHDAKLSVLLPAVQQLHIHLSDAPAIALAELLRGHGSLERLVLEHDEEDGGSWPEGALASMAQLHGLLLRRFRSSNLDELLSDAGSCAKLEELEVEADSAHYVYVQVQVSGDHLGVLAAGAAGKVLRRVALHTCRGWRPKQRFEQVLQAREAAQLLAFDVAHVARLLRGCMAQLRELDVDVKVDSEELRGEREAGGRGGGGVGAAACRLVGRQLMAAGVQGPVQLRVVEEEGEEYSRPPLCFEPRFSVEVRGSVGAVQVSMHVWPA